MCCWLVGSCGVYFFLGFGVSFWLAYSRVIASANPQVPSIIFFCIAVTFSVLDGLVVVVVMVVAVVVVVVISSFPSAVSIKEGCKKINM